MLGSFVALQVLAWASILAGVVLAAYTWAGGKRPGSRSPSAAGVNAEIRALQLVALALALQLLSLLTYLL